MRVEISSYNPLQDIQSIGDMLKQVSVAGFGDKPAANEQCALLLGVVASQLKVMQLHMQALTDINQLVTDCDDACDYASDMLQCKGDPYYGMVCETLAKKITGLSIRFDAFASTLSSKYGSVTVIN